MRQNFPYLPAVRLYEFACHTRAQYIFIEEFRIRIVLRREVHRLQSIFQNIRFRITQVFSGKCSQHRQSSLHIALFIGLGNEFPYLAPVALGVNELTASFFRIFP